MAGGKNVSCAAYIGGTTGLKIDLDSFRCFFVYYSVFLNKIQFGYICIALLIVIMIVTIFGGIKENYRWFVLNQAFWDLAISYSFICNNSTTFTFYGIYTPSCFYNFETEWLKDFFGYSIDTNSYSALMLFSISRFIGLYYSHFYQKLTQKRNIVFVIFIFNFIVIFTNIHSLFSHLRDQRANFLEEECIKQAGRKRLNENSCLESYDYDFQLYLFTTLFNIFSSIMFLKPMICLFLSLVAAIFLILQVSKQFKFQYKNNKKNLMNSIRICVVITLQIIINLSVFFLEFVKNIPMFMGNTFSVTILTSKTSWECDECVYYILPDWLVGNYGLSYSPVLQAIVQSRIFIDSILTLFIMTGYREGIVRIIKRPHEILKRYKQIHPGITTTRVSAFHPNNTRTRVSSFHS